MRSGAYVQVNVKEDLEGVIKKKKYFTNFFLKKIILGKCSTNCD